MHLTMRKVCINYKESVSSLNLWKFDIKSRDDI